MEEAAWLGRALREKLHARRAHEAPPDPWSEVHITEDDVMGNLRHGQ